MDSLQKNSGKIALALILTVLFVFGLTSCSKEARMERHWKKGEKYFSENKFPEAALEYKNVIQLDPKNAKARYKLGMTCLKTGAFGDAYKELSKAIELNPDMMDARNQFGFLLLLGRSAGLAAPRSG